MSTGSGEDSVTGVDKNVELGEKRPAQATHSPAIDELGDHGQHILDVSQLTGEEKRNVKVAKDGQTVLIPQPSDDPNDPLNWSPLKKHITLSVIAVVAFMPDFGSSMGIVTLLPQAMYTLQISQSILGSPSCNI